MRKAHLFIDMQNDFITGSLASPKDDIQIGGVAAVSNASKYMLSNISKNDLVYFTLDTHNKDYLKTQEGSKLPIEHCLKGTSGHVIHDDLLNTISIIAASYKGEVDIQFLEKVGFGAVNVVNDLETQHAIQPLESITIMGICTDICVVTTAALLKSSPILKEVPIKLYEKGCSGVSGELHRSAVDVMKSFQVEII